MQSSRLLDRKVLQVKSIMGASVRLVNSRVLVLFFPFVSHRTLLLGKDVLRVPRVRKGRQPKAEVARECLRNAMLVRRIDSG
jgi:hypothetical protein